MGATEESLEPQSVLSDLHDAVDAVFLALGNNSEWGLSGKRPDQYVSDVVADAASTIRSQFAELVLVVNGCEPCEVCAVLQK